MSTNFFKKFLALASEFGDAAPTELRDLSSHDRADRYQTPVTACRSAGVCLFFAAASRDQLPSEIAARSTDLSEIGALYIDEAFRSLRGHKRLADDSIVQLSDEQFFAVPDAESNSVAVILSTWRATCVRASPIF